MSKFIKPNLLLCLALLFLSSVDGQQKPKQAIAKTQSTSSNAKQNQDDEEPIINKTTQDPNKPVVAIYHFTTARDYSYDYALGAGNAVEAGFLKSTRFTLVERNRFGSIAQEDRFREANTNDLVRKASKLGAKIIVTGHIVGVSKGDIVSSNNQATGKEYAEISLSFKIIDVESSEIKYSEIIRGKGVGTNNTEAIQNAYQALVNLARANVGKYMPQRFKFMSIVSTTVKKKIDYLDYFKIWGGSDNGLQVGDVIEMYQISFITNPNTNKQIEEKKLIAQATITEINSGSTATCTIANTASATKFNAEILEIAKKEPQNIILEYKGNWYEKPKSFWDIL